MESYLFIPSDKPERKRHLLSQVANPGAKNRLHKSDVECGELECVRGHFLHHMVGTEMAQNAPYHLEEIG